MTFASKGHEWHRRHTIALSQIIKTDGIVFWRVQVDRHFGGEAFFLYGLLFGRHLVSVVIDENGGVVVLWK